MKKAEEKRIGEGNKEEGVLLSQYANNKIKEIDGRYMDWRVGFRVVVSMVAVVACVILGAGFENKKELLFIDRVLILLAPFFTGTVLVVSIEKVWWLIIRKRYLAKKEKIIFQNKKDYLLSKELEIVLENFSVVESSRFSVIEKKISGGQWKPFRVEHFVSESLREEIVGTLTVGIPILCGRAHGDFKGNANGILTPNLLDSSSMLFLKDGDKTMRVIIPSPTTTKEMFVKTMEFCLSTVPELTHTRQALQDFSIKDQNLLIPISHPEVIDYLDSACELPTERRPEVVVIGEVVQKGVALATALEINGKSTIFFPSGLFKEVEKTIPLLLGELIEEPKANVK